MELEEELRVVGNNLKSLEVSEEKVHVYNPVKLIICVFQNVFSKYLNSVVPTSIILFKEINVSDKVKTIYNPAIQQL